MDAIILAAGRGSRLGDITADNPKPLTPLAGKSLFDWQCQALGAAGISKISVVTGFAAQAFVGFDGEKFHNPRWHQSNMVESLRQAAPRLRQQDHLISYGDIAYRASIVQELMSSDADIAISCDLDWYGLWQARFADPLSDAETFEQINGQLTAIGERTTEIRQIQGQYMGLLKVTATGWKLIEGMLDSLTDEQVCRLDMTSLLRALVAQDVKIAVVNVNGGWVEVDTPEDLQLYEKMIASEGWSHDWRGA